MILLVIMQANIAALEQKGRQCDSSDILSPANTRVVTLMTFPFLCVTLGYVTASAQYVHKN